MPATAQDLLATLGDPSRRAIFDVLAKGPATVGEIAEHLPVSRSAVSQHLKVLKDAGLVTMTPAGTRHVFRIDPEGLEAMRSYLDAVWTQSLAGFKDEIDKSKRRK